MTNLVYYSRGVTGYTDKFVQRLGLPAERIPDSIKEAKDFRATEPYVLISPTYESDRAHGKGRTFVPRQVATFLNIPENRDLMVAVIGTGHRNFLDDYGKVVEEIHNKTGVEVLGIAELAGTDKEVFEIQKRIEEFWLTQKSATQAISI